MTISKGDNEMTKSRIIPVLLTLALIASVFCSCSKKSDVDIPDGYQLASADEADYYFFIPATWTVDTKTTAYAAYASSSDPASISVMTWSLSNTDSTLEEWWNTFLPDFEKVYSDFSLISDENILINSVAAKKMTFTGAIGGTSYKFIQASAIKDSVVYVITYTSTADRFDEHTEEMQSVLEYFEFK